MAAQCHCAARLYSWDRSAAACRCASATNSCQSTSPSASVAAPDVAGSSDLIGRTCSSDLIGGAWKPIAFRSPRGGGMPSGTGADGIRAARPAASHTAVSQSTDPQPASFLRGARSRIRNCRLCLSSTETKSLSIAENRLGSHYEGAVLLAQANAASVSSTAPSSNAASVRLQSSSTHHADTTGRNRSMYLFYLR
jgi:hypothetical protein